VRNLDEDTTALSRRGTDIAGLKPTLVSTRVPKLQTEVCATDRQRPVRFDREARMLPLRTGPSVVFRIKTNKKRAGTMPTPRRLWNSASNRLLTAPSTRSDRKGQSSCEPFYGRRWAVTPNLTMNPGQDFSIGRPVVKSASFDFSVRDG